ncbi:glycosyltransferase family 2 protein [Chryseobacterium sp. Bi04]|uniref:glycosyltransferase family 2 protein n=1 Tax=Chryseobacterium sp. Bi04 TaxID=2822345 RepID=UPI001E2B2090|nr:glycosyltransferase family 2 protein [Chryseobacterium sp. Bi04]
MKISVIIPVYNAEKFIRNAVESAVRLEEVCEVILIEDQSPDNALAICKELTSKHNKVKLYRHKDNVNCGAGLSRNLGIKNAVGDFIAFLDADDFYLPNRFNAEKELFKDPKVEGVYGAIGVCYYSQKAKNKYYKVFGERLTTVYKRYKPEDVFPGQIGMIGSFGLFSVDALTIRKDALFKMNILFKSLRMHEDTEFLFRLSYYLDLYPGILDRPVAMRGIHENNRITKIETREEKPAKTRVLLWKEIKDWAESEVEISKEAKTHIIRMHRSFEIANSRWLIKRIMILKYAILDYYSIRSGLYNINFFNRGKYRLK